MNEKSHLLKQNILFQRAIIAVLSATAWGVGPIDAAVGKADTENIKTVQTSEETGENSPAAVSSGASTGADSTDRSATKDDPEFQREMVRAMFLVAIFVTAGFFLFVLVLTLMRMGRHHRKRNKIGQKGDRTEYIDAWSRYKLKDEDKL
jgi:hypothetical protein